MKSGGCGGCPFARSTAVGCCRGCTRLLPEIPAVPVLGEAAFQETAPVSQTELSVFLENHPRPGTLKIQAFRGDQVLPVPGVQVVISREFDGQNKTFFQGVTDWSGIIDPIFLPGAKPAETLEPETAKSTATYNLVASHLDYETLETVVDIFEGIKTVQPISLFLKQGGV